MNSQHKQIIISYVPSPHRGYVEFFEKYKGGILYILGKDFIEDFSSLTRNLPGNDPEVVQKMIEALNMFSEVRVLTKENIHEVPTESEIVMPDEDVSHKLADTYFSNAKIHFDNAWRLRWHWDATVKKQQLEDAPVISISDFDREMMRKAKEVGGRSSDWWRQIGGLLVKDGEILLVGFNKHYPSEQSPYLYGDPRSNFDVGQHIDVSSALHAEVSIISEAARRGIQTEGCDLYVSTFPCPPCAYACANSGLKRLFYSEGYSLVEGGEALRSRGVEIIRVDLEK